MRFAQIGAISRFGSDFDSDAAAFILATGITDGTIKAALHCLVVSAKANGWWTLCSAIYPFVGGTATTCKFNLKDPRDLDAAFRLTFVGSPTITANGVDWDGATQYADTHLNPNTVLTANSCHISYYSTESDSGSVYDMGAQTSANTAQRLLMEIQFGGQFTVNIYDAATSGIGVANTVGTGFYIATRTGATTLNGYKAGTSVGSNGGAAGTQPNANVFIGACSNGVAVLNFGKLQCSFASIGAGISGAIAALMTTDIQTFQLTLSRAINF